MAFKKNKAKMIGVVTTIAAASLVSVGFAAWSIANVKTDNVNNSITVHGEVSENILSFGLHNGSPSSGSFVFGKPAAMEIENAWLLPDTSVGTDSLSALVVTWDYTVRSGYTPTANKEYIQDEDYETWAAAVEKGYVKEVAFTAVASDGVLTLTFQVGWGSYFNYVNPYTFYNGSNHKYDETVPNSNPAKTYGQHATDALNDDVFKNLSGISLKLRVKLS